MSNLSFQPEGKQREAHSQPLGPANPAHPSDRGGRALRLWLTCSRCFSRRFDQDRSPIPPPSRRPRHIRAAAQPRPALCARSLAARSRRVAFPAGTPGAATLSRPGHWPPDSAAGAVAAGCLGSSLSPRTPCRHQSAYLDLPLVGRLPAGLVIAPPAAVHRALPCLRREDARASPAILDRAAKIRVVRLRGPRSSTGEHHRRVRGDSRILPSSRCRQGRLQCHALPPSTMLITTAPP